MKDIEKSNKLIADFMGLKTFTFKHVTGLFCCGSDQDEYVNYHRSWDWLIPVVEKLANMQDFEDYAIGQGWYCEGHPFYVFEGKSTIKTWYPECVKFIKWYNKQNKV